MPKKESEWRDRPLEIVHGGRRFVPVERNGYFVASFVYKVMKQGGIEIGGQRYKIASTAIEHGGRGKAYRYVCEADLKRIVQALNENKNVKMRDRAEIMKYIMDHADDYSTHHYTYRAFTSLICAKLGRRISRFVVADAVRRCRKREPRILIGLRPVRLICKLLEEQPELRVAQPLLETIRRIAEKRFGCRFTHHTIRRAINSHDDKQGHPSEFVDREKWATMEEATAFLGVTKNTILSARRQKKLVVVGLLQYCTYVTWESLRAYKERRDAYIAKYPRSGRVQGMADSEQEFSAK